MKKGAHTERPFSFVITYLKRAPNALPRRPRRARRTASYGGHAHDGLGFASGAPSGTMTFSLCLLTPWELETPDWRAEETVDSKDAVV